MAASFRFGIEEELFLADAASRRTPSRRKLDTFHAAVKQRLPSAERELLQAQIEISSAPTTRFAEARAELSGLRSSLAEIAHDHDVLLFAAGTHPLARWDQQRRTKKARYEAVTDEMQMIARRNVVCGMHVHVEVPDPDRRIDLMNRLLPYMPLLLALSASSPFWQGRRTGLAAYRLSVWGELPRTGLPDVFANNEDYERYVNAMVAGGAIKDASFLWWALRPSMHYPTLELRVSDSCTSLDDTLAVAAIYRCLVRRVVRDPRLNIGLDGAARAIVSENLWRAQRDGVRARFIGLDSDPVTCSDYLATVVEEITEDASELGCKAELARAQEIVSRGTSADLQIAVWENASLEAVVDWLADVTHASLR